MNTPENREEVIMYQIEQLTQDFPCWIQSPLSYHEESLNRDRPSTLEDWKEALISLSIKMPRRAFRLVQHKCLVLEVVGFPLRERGSHE